MYYIKRKGAFIKMNDYTLYNLEVGRKEVSFDKARLYFNKIEMYKLLAPYKFPFKMPYTTVLSVQSLEEFTNNNTPFYIKPVHTWAGMNISRVSRHYHGYLLKQPSGSNETFPTKQALLQRLAFLYTNTQVIIQQQTPTMTFDSKTFDIRVHLQRDERGKWLYAGDLIRIGGKESIVSNHFSNGGGVTETDYILQELFPYTQVQKIKNNLVAATFSIAELLDSYYPFIDIGADFGVDQNGELWLFEVNTNDRQGRPAYDLFKKLPDRSTYKQMVAIDKRRRKVWKKNRIYF